MIGEHLIAGIVQLQSTPDVEHNILSAIEGITQAAKLGADWICLPENTPYLGPTQGLLRAAQPPDGEIIQRLQEVAKRLHVWLLIGSFPERGPDPDHAYNTSALISNTGDLKALYRKLHPPLQPFAGAALAGDAPTACALTRRGCVPAILSSLRRPHAPAGQAGPDLRGWGGQISPNDSLYIDTPKGATEASLCAVIGRPRIRLFCTPRSLPFTRSLPLTRRSAL
jgi:hypothetical protein